MSLADRPSNSDPAGDRNPPPEDLRRRGLHRADGLDGADIARVPQGADLPELQVPFVIGMDEQGVSGRPVCPNCGQGGLGEVAAVECNGDRLLVQKFLFDVRRPRRWEVAVFHNPGDPTRPTSSGWSAARRVDPDRRWRRLYRRPDRRKSLGEQRAMRILVFDNDYVPADSDRFPRWRLPRRPVRPVVSGWKAEGPRFIHAMTPTSNDREDWLEYLHFDPTVAVRGRSAISCPYNGGDFRGDNVVRDLMLEATSRSGPDVEVFDRAARPRDRPLHRRPPGRCSGTPGGLGGTAGSSAQQRSRRTDVLALRLAEVRPA